MQHNIKCYSGYLMKILVFFHIAIYIAGLKKKKRNVSFFSNIVQPYHVATASLTLVLATGNTSHLLVENTDWSSNYTN